MNRRQLLPSLHFDGKLVVAAYAVRALDYGFLSVYLGVYVSLLGLTTLQAGLVFSSIMAGGALSLEMGPRQSGWARSNRPPSHPRV